MHFSHVNIDRPTASKQEKEIEAVASVESKHQDVLDAESGGACADSAISRTPLRRPPPRAEPEDNYDFFLLTPHEAGFPVIREILSLSQPAFTATQYVGGLTIREQRVAETELSGETPRSSALEEIDDDFDDELSAVFNANQVMNASFQLQPRVRCKRN